MNISTNNKKRDLIYRCEVPEKILADQFDYLDEDTDGGFIYYQKCWYHLSDFMRVESDGNLALSGFDGYHSDSHFSGVLIKICDCGESVIMATYIA